jgi:ribonuclease G
LVEIIVDDANDASLVGNIYAGLVKSILPSQFAFVDIGLPKNAFVYLSDGREAGLFEDGKLRLKNGQTLLVQVLKDASGEKGVYVTSRIAYTGRYLVVSGGYREGIRAVAGVSKKIEDRDERERLKKIILGIAEDGMEIIIRTNAMGVSADVLLCEYNNTIQFMKTNL